MTKKRRGIFRTGVRKCHYCRRDRDLVQLTEDHIVPRSRGGENKVWNIVAACVDCNSRKGNNWPTCECDFCQWAITRHRQFHLM